MTTETPSQRRLANALRSLKELQDRGLTVLRSVDISRPVRESLVTNGFLRPIIKGWYMPSRPDESDGESTAWYASANDFIARYGEERFGTAWCVSADHSIRLHVGNASLPPQVVMNAPAAQNSIIGLPAKHSILDYRAKDFPDPKNLTTVGRLRVMKLEHALTRVSEAFFRTYSRDAHIALISLRDSSELTRQLLSAGQSVVAGRLAGALRACGQAAFADDIVVTMKGVGYSVVEMNPFADPPPTLKIIRGESPYVTRIRLMWESMRGKVIAAFPPAPGLPTNPNAYMTAVMDSYVRDAYNSLSIEGYRVTNDLIERVAAGNWNSELNEVDRQSRDAMAARGYYQARKAVEGSINKILAGENAGHIAAREHRAWFRELFAPSVDAKILTAQELAGYRGHQVFIRNASHVPPPVEAVRDMMPALFDLLETEPDASVRAVLGHFLFVFIHPYMDGNGRIGRFLMNAMLASGGYPWTVIEVVRRSEYMDALNEASSKGNIVPFAQFVASSMHHYAGHLESKTTPARATTSLRRPKP